MKRFKKTKKHGKLGALLFGLLINLITFLASILIFAIIASGLENPLQAIKLGSIISFFISGALSGIIISVINGEGGTITALLSALSFSVILLCVGFIFKEGSFPLINALNYIIYCFIAFILARLCRGFKKKRRI